MRRALVTVLLWCAEQLTRCAVRLAARMPEPNPVLRYLDSQKRRTAGQIARAAELRLRDRAQVLVGLEDLAERRLEQDHTRRRFRRG